MTRRLGLALAFAAAPAWAAEPTFSSPSVAYRMGVVQVLLRDRHAGPHTPDMASAKAYTAVSFRTNTTELAEMTQPGRPQSGIRSRPGVAAG